MVEWVEARVLLTDFTVTSTGDSANDTTTLRYALSHAATGDRILFNIPPSPSDPNYHPATGSWTIPVGSPLPAVLSPSIVIDGLSQQSVPGASTTHPAIEITPSAGFAGDGLTLASGSETVRGLAIDGFQGVGLLVGPGSSGNLITGNFIGTDVTGTAPRPNGGGGILVLSSGNTIGGTVAGAGNTIAFNTGSGVAVDTGTGDAILSNSIADNAGGGIVLTNGGNNNQVAPVLSDALLYADRTVVDGTLSVQAGTGYLVQFFANDPPSGQGRTLLGSQAISPQTTDGTVTLSFTTTTTLPLGSTVTAIASVTSTTPTESLNPATGDTSAFSNAVILVNPFIVTNTLDFGIGSLRFAVQAANADLAHDDTITFRIPTQDPGFSAATGSWTIPVNSGLTISKPPTEGGAQHTVFIDGLSQQSQPGASPAHPVIVVTKGGDFTGSQGLTISSGGNTVSGLVIDGFPGSGIVIGSGASGDVIRGCFIGTDALGTTAVPNGGSGVDLAGPSNTIADNVISGNLLDGILFDGSGASNNAVVGNFIGTNAAGTAALGNGTPGKLQGGAGVRFFGGTSNTIGGTAVNDRNVISGNVNEGIFSHGDRGANHEVILGNFIGTNAAGTSALGNGLSGITLSLSSGNTVLGNVVSGNGVRPIGGSGITLAGRGAQGNLIASNFIGTNAAGTGALPNLGDGVAIGGPNNTVGGTAAGARNIISGNQGHGLSISGASGNAISGNFIGAGADGATAAGNGLDGIFLDNASANTVSGNVISANGVGQDAAGINMTGSGSAGNLISENRIGTDANGATALGNSLHGIFIGDGASNNTVGPGNVISGNGLATDQGVGVYLFGTTTSGNLVVGNRIGTNAAGTAPLTETVIGVLISQAPGNTVRGNLISGNRFVGLEVAGATASGNRILGNMIGTDAAGTRAIPNGFDGVFINDAPNNTIGGTSAGAGNLISGNGSVGIQLFGPQAVGNVVDGNAIGLDSAGRLSLPNRNGGIFVNTGPQANSIGGTAPGRANAGQRRAVFSLSGFHQAHRARRARTRRPAVRQKAVARHGTRPALRLHAHWPITGGVVKAAALAAPLPKGILSIRANSPLNGKGPVTGRT